MKMHNVGKVTALLAAVAMWVGMGTSANAALYWQNITGTDPYDVSDQLSMEVGGLGTQLILTFRNNVGIASSICDVYIDAPPPGSGDAGWLGSTMTIGSSSGVIFGVGANPPNLPGGQNVDFVASASADSNPRRLGVMENGVNAASEWLALHFTFLGAHTIDDVTAALNSGDFRVGVHIQGLPDGGSDSYVLVPEPTTVIAGALLLLPFGVSTLRILRKKRAA
jgi:hypothetical protein